MNALEGNPSEVRLAVVNELHEVNHVQEGKDYPDEIERKGAFHGAGADYTDEKTKVKKLILLRLHI